VKATDPRIKAALEEMARQHVERLTADGLAAQLGLSRSRFEHLFKQHTGTTFRHHLRETRLVKARRLLADPGLRVKEVASKRGYATTSDLTRAFRERFGLSPSRYRRSRFR